MKNITIRKGTIADFPQFYTYFHKSQSEQFPQYSPLTREFIIERVYKKSLLKKEIKHGDKDVFLAMDGKKVIGCILISPVLSGVSYAFELAVSPAYQRRGIASQLLLIWEQDVRKHNGHSLQLWTSKKDNVPFYNKNKFTTGGVFANGWFGADYTLLYKSLGPAREENYLRAFLKEKKQGL